MQGVPVEKGQITAPDWVQPVPVEQNLIKIPRQYGPDGRPINKLDRAVGVVASVLASLLLCGGGMYAFYAINNIK